MPIDPARLVRLNDLTIPDVERVDIEAFTAERATVAVDGFSRLEGLYCLACAPAQFDLMADRISCPVCECPTEPGVALARRDAYAVLAGLCRLPVEEGVLIERANTHMLELARHYFYRLPLIHDASDRALTWAYSRHGQELIIAAAKELHDNAVTADPERPYQVRESTDS